MKKNPIEKHKHMFLDEDTIFALSTPDSPSAISVIRISGIQSISIIDTIFHPVKKFVKKLEEQSTHTIHLGFFGEKLSLKKKFYIDQVLVSIFKKPFSYTGENMVEISCHGSHYIRQTIFQLLIKKGMRLARPGEFTLRAFMNKKIDLTQAEAIIDLIRSENESSHDISLQQIKGDLTKEIKMIRKKLLDLISIIELELDFSEENLILSKKEDYIRLLKIVKKDIEILMKSFLLGNALKKGIKVIIIGEPNVGKSTLFNQIIQEKRSIISSIPGTTRDFLEESIILNGILFRFLDTAGIRKTKNPIEIMGIEKTMSELENSQVIFYLFNSFVQDLFQQKKIFHQITFFCKKYPLKDFFIIANKSDISKFKDLYHIKSISPFFFEISSKKNQEVKKILDILSHLFFERKKKNKVIITQIRHYEALKKSIKEISLSISLFQKKFSEDLISFHLKEAILFLGEIMGKMDNKEVLTNIFSKFCIGK